MRKVTVASERSRDSHNVQVVNKRNYPPRELSGTWAGRGRTLRGAGYAGGTGGRGLAVAGWGTNTHGGRGLRRTRPKVCWEGKTFLGVFPPPLALGLTPFPASRRPRRIISFLAIDSIVYAARKHQHRAK